MTTVHQSSPLGLRVSVFNRRLKMAIEESGLAMKELAQRVGVQPQLISAITNLRYKPRPLLQDAIALELGYTTDYLFPATVTALTGRHKAIELPLTEADLLNSARLADPRSPLDDAEMQVDRDILARAIDTVLAANLTTRERLFVALRYGLNGEAPHTDEAIGQAYGLTRGRVYQIETRALEKLRKYGRSRALRPYLEH